MARTTEIITRPSGTYDLKLRMLTSAFIIGAIVGAVGWLINLFLRYYFVEPVFCASPDSFSACANGGTIAWVLAQILVIGASLVAMVRFAIYRPLLVIIAVFVTVWGIGGWLGVQNWWVATLWQAGIFGLAYATYAWIARVTQFWVSAILLILAVVICRLVLSWS